MNYSENMQNLQNRFLNQARKDKTPVTVFLTNGFQMHGTIHSFDQATVLIVSDNKQNLVYKRAISTVQPETPVTLTQQQAP